MDQQIGAVCENVITSAGSVKEKLRADVSTAVGFGPVEPDFTCGMTSECINWFLENGSFMMPCEHRFTTQRGACVFL